MNVISRSGGNTFSGSLFGNFANSSMTSTNVTQDLLNAGLKVPNALEKNWDTSAFYGGPVKKDRLWFFVNARHQGNRNLVSGVWRNLNAGDSTKWTYQPDLSQQAKSDGTWKNAGLRLTVQATARNKFVAWWDEQSVCRLCLPLASTPTAAPEATNQAGARPERAARLTWTSPVTNRLLLEANIRQHAERYGGRENGSNRDLIRINEQAGLIPGLNYRSQNWSHPFVRTIAPSASLSYITGAHSLKTGFTYTAYPRRAENDTNDALLMYRFRRRAQSAHDDCCPGDQYVQRNTDTGRLFGGSVDVQPNDAARRPPLRARQQLFSATTAGAEPFHSGGDRIPCAGQPDQPSRTVPRGVVSPWTCSGIREQHSR